MYNMNKPDIAELSYLFYTHQAEENVKPTLFKIRIPHDEHLENLLVLLDDNNCMATSSHASLFNLQAKDDLSKKS